MNRLQRILALGAVVFALAVMGHLWVSDQGVPKLTRLRAEVASTDAQIAKLQTQAGALQQTIEALRQDPAVQRQVLRDRLGYVEDGDWVIDLGPGVKDALARP